MITEERLRELAALRGEPVVSLYLDVDGRRFPKLADVEPHLQELVRAARRRAAERGFDDAAVAAALQRIEGAVRQGFDRSVTRGVAFFGAADWIETIEVPRSVRNAVTVNQSPAVRQLEWLADEYERLMVVLVDRQRARFYRFELGELVERQEVFDPVPPRVEDAGRGDPAHQQQHSDEVARRHLKHAAEVALQELQQWEAERVLLGGPRATVAEFEEILHPYVRERVIERVSISVTAPEAEVRGVAVAAEEEAERRDEARAVERLREALASDRGSAGVADTLRAVYERRVDVLLVSHGYEEPGWRCGSCDYLAQRGSTCPMCDGAMYQTDDVVGEAIDQALLANSTIEICENADLDVLGRVGAILRF